jgi:beta-glucosidase
MNPDAVDQTYSFQQWLDATPVEMIDTAVRRILTTKFSLGIFENPYGDAAAGDAAGNDPAHKKLAVDAALETLTVLRNPNKILPLKLASGDNIVVTGANADLGSAQSIWTSYFHSNGGKTILGGLQDRAAAAGVTVNGAAAPKVAIVVVGEKSYTHGSAWPLVQDYLPDSDKAPITEYKGQNVPVVVVMFLPRPYVITDWHEQADAIVAIYRPGDGGGEAVAKLLFGDAAPRGKLPWHLPRSMDQVGDESKNQNERWDLPFDVGATDAERAEIRALIDEGKPVPPTYGDPLYRFGDGLQGW